MNCVISLFKAFSACVTYIKFNGGRKAGNHKNVNLNLPSLFLRAVLSLHILSSYLAMPKIISHVHFLCNLLVASTNCHVSFMKFKAWYIELKLDAREVFFVLCANFVLGSWVQSGVVSYVFRLHGNSLICHVVLGFAFENKVNCNPRPHVWQMQVTVANPDFRKAIDSSLILPLIHTSGLIHIFDYFLRR